MIKLGLCFSKRSLLQEPDKTETVWQSAFLPSKISAIVSPTGKEALVPIDVYSCGNCGKVPKTMLAGTGLDLENL